jgi:hypothetical protein
MRKLLIAVCLILLARSQSMAKENLETHWLCPKPADQYRVKVGEEAGHTYAVAIGTCIPSGSNTFQEKTGTFWNFTDTVGSTSKVQGAFVSTTLSGDRISYSTAGTYSLNNDAIQSGTLTWSLAGGTGKFAAIGGYGACTAQGNADGTTSFTCAGSYNP